MLSIIFVFVFLLTIRKCQNTDDKEEGDDQDEPHPEITVRISIISADTENIFQPSVNIISDVMVYL